jgi:hypothetical protein
LAFGGLCFSYVTVAAVLLLVAGESVSIGSNQLGMAHRAKR